MKSYSSREVIKILQENGWTLKRIEGSHHHFVHEKQKGVVTIPHPKKDIHPKTLMSILKQAGIDIS